MKVELTQKEIDRLYFDLKDEDGLRNVNYLLDELNKNIKE